MFTFERPAMIVQYYTINDFHRSPDASILGGRAVVVFLLAAQGVGSDAGVECAVVTTQDVAVPWFAFLHAGIEYA